MYVSYQFSVQLLCRLSSPLNSVKSSNLFPSRVTSSGRPTHSLAFFESAIFQEFSRERLKSCLIISDSLGYHNALTEAAALQGAAHDYIVVRAPISGSFHPKVWLVVGDTEAALLTGSGNLTQAGFMTNAELFDALHFTPDNPPTAELLADLRSFITGLAGMWRPEDHQELLCVETLT